MGPSRPAGSSAAPEGFSEGSGSRGCSGSSRGVQRLGHRSGLAGRCPAGLRGCRAGRGCAARCQPAAAAPWAAHECRSSDVSARSPLGSCCGQRPAMSRGAVYVQPGQRQSAVRRHRQLPRSECTASPGAVWGNQGVVFTTYDENCDAYGLVWVWSATREVRTLQQQQNKPSLARQPQQRSMSPHFRAIPLLLRHTSHHRPALFCGTYYSSQGLQ